MVWPGVWFCGSAAQAGEPSNRFSTVLRLVYLLRKVYLSFGRSTGRVVGALVVVVVLDQWPTEHGPVV